MMSPVIDVDELVDGAEREMALRNVRVIVERIRESHRARVTAGTLAPRTAAERHAAECGHELAYGCCGMDNGREAA